MEKQTKESKAKGPKGKLISQRIIVWGCWTFILGCMAKNTNTALFTTLLYTGLGLVLAGNLYRLYHFKVYKRYNILTVTAIAISAVIVVVIKYMQ